MPNGGIRIPRSRDSSSERIQIHMDSFRCTGCDQSVQTPQTFLGKLHGCGIFPDRPAEMIRAIIIEHMETYAVHSQLPEPLCQQFAVIFRQKTGSSCDVGPVKADRDSPHLSYRNHLFCSIFLFAFEKTSSPHQTLHLFPLLQSVPRQGVVYRPAMQIGSNRTGQCIAFGLSR